MSTDTCTTNKCKRQRGLFMQQQNAFYLNAFLLCIRQSHDAGELARLYCAAHLWNDALLACFWSSHHRVTFSCARLSISEDAHVVSVDGMLQHFDSNVLIDTLLTRKLSVVWLHRTNTSRTIDHPQAAAASLTVLWLKNSLKCTVFRSPGNITQGSQSCFTSTAKQFFSSNGTPFWRYLHYPH